MIVEVRRIGTRIQPEVNVEVSPENRALQNIRQLYENLRLATRQRWRRDLPFDELVFDRWERSASLGFGEGSSIYHMSYVFGDVQVGDHTWIGPYTVLDGSGGLMIGSYCSISSGVHIYSHDTVQWALTRGRGEPERASVSIEDCCYIGAQAVIAKGVTIGHHSVVGACAFVNRSLPPYSIAAGVPARVIGEVHEREDGGVDLSYPA